MALPKLSIYARLPPLHLLDWRLEGAPETISPISQSGVTWTQPFTIPSAFFHGLLDIKVPVTIAATYLVTVTILNRLNESRKYKPWRISKTSTFKIFVLSHNIFLAVFSAWTFCGLYYSTKSCGPSKADPNFFSQAADSLCRITGELQRGMPNATLESNESLQFSHESVLLSIDSVAQSDSNRLWTTGYAYFSWLFYLSKFYEVVDTLIILAKGRKSSLLQTYHHTGVMFCMWAGVRHMSPPGIVGIFLNSAIHALMYSYFAWTSIGLPVSGYVKRTLTTLQITQFFLGGFIGIAYLFIEYEYLVHRPEYGSRGPSPSIAEDAAMLKAQEQDPQGVESRFEVRRTPCLMSSSQVFPVWLTIIYILPLIYLFLRFFSRSYLRRVKCHVE